MFHLKSDMHHPKIAIIYLSFHCQPYIDDVISALKNLTYPRDRVELVIVDNPHPTYGPSVRYIEENVMSLSGKEIPHVTLLPQSENLGFAGGNNAGVTWALENGFDYIYFHNNDGFVATNCFEPLVKAMQEDPEVGIAQSLLLLHPETELINSTGNSFHYLGFGFCDRYRVPIRDVDLQEKEKIGYASGAGMMVSADTIREFGSWDEDFFLYHEDLEWSFRLRCAGKKIIMVTDSVFYHKYQFTRSIQKFYWMERNRYGVMLMFFHPLTLLLLLPMGLVLELGLIVFSLKGGWFAERMRVYGYWTKTKHWKLWLKKRKRIQSIKKISDRDLLSVSVPGIYFQDESMKNPLLIYIGNPVMKLYWRIVVKGLIRW